MHAIRAIAAETTMGSRVAVAGPCSVDGRVCGDIAVIRHVTAAVTSPAMEDAASWVIAAGQVAMDTPGAVVPRMQNQAVRSLSMPVSRHSLIRSSQADRFINHTSRVVLGKYSGQRNESQTAARQSRSTTEVPVL